MFICIYSYIASSSLFRIAVLQLGHRQALPSQNTFCSTTEGEQGERERKNEEAREAEREKEERGRRE